MERIFYSNYEFDRLFDYAKDGLINSGFENPTEQEVLDEVEFLDNDAWYETERLLRKVFDASNDIFIAQGLFGRWNGNFRGGLIFKTLDELLKAFLDCDYIQIYDIDGEFYIRGSHHDGDNYLKVRKLNDKGVNYLYHYDDILTTGELHDRLFTDEHSINPEVAKSNWNHWSLAELLDDFYLNREVA